MSAKYPQHLARLIEALEVLPGVGARTAERLAFFIIKQPAAFGAELADAITQAKARVRHCTVCFNVCQGDLCPVCEDPARDRSLVAVVESPREMLSLEASGTFKGVYHCLLGRLAPADGVGESDLTIAALVNRCRAGGKASKWPAITEVILATNPDMGGDATALAVARALEPTGVRVSRLARGVPAGYQLDLLSGGVLEEALNGRQTLRVERRSAP